MLRANIKLLMYILKYMYTMPLRYSGVAKTISSFCMCKFFFFRYYKRTIDLKHTVNQPFLRVSNIREICDSLFVANISRRELVFAVLVLYQKECE